MHPSNTDPLTGLLARQAFLDIFTQAIPQAGDERPLSLAFIDVDTFLDINAAYGRSGGDQVLKTIAALLQETMNGEGVTVSRYGGDEFVVLFEGVEREKAFLNLEGVRARVEQNSIPNPGGQSITGVTISAGVASYPIDGRTPEELLRKADQALYRAKVAGRNQVKLAYEEKMIPKTTLFTQTQLERLANLASELGRNESELLRLALDDLLAKYGLTKIEP